MAVATFVCLGLLAAGCGGSTSGSATATPNGTPKLNEVGAALEPDDDPTRGGKLVVAVPAETNGWNPSVNQWADAGSLVGSSFLEPLLLMDGNGVSQPYLLDTWTHNADFTQWDLTLHPGIKFQNGQELDSKALQQNIVATYSTGLTKVALGPLYDHVEITGPLSVKVFLKIKWAQYPATLNTHWMMAPEMLESADLGVVHPIGTGPFTFDEWQQGRYLRAKKNPTYWRKDKSGRQLPFLDEIEFRPVVDEDSKQKALQANDVDIAETTSAQLATNLEDDFTVLRDYTSERTFVMLNTVEAEQNKPNPFTNIHARKALAYATDRKAIAELVGENVQITTQGYRPDSQWGIPEDQAGYYAFDQAKAKEEVEAYKKDTGKSELAFTLTGLTNLDDTKLMQALQAQWQEVGINSKLDAVDQVKYISLIALGLYQAGWFRWYGYANPDSNYVFHASEDVAPIGQLSINFTHFSTPEMDKDLLTTREQEDPAVRKAANDKVIQEINKAAVNIWLYDTPYAIVAAKKVRGLNGFRTTPFGNFGPKPWWGDVWIQK